jgi:hypothetical protein
VVRLKDMNLVQCGNARSESGYGTAIPNILPVIGCGKQHEKLRDCWKALPKGFLKLIYILTK